MARDPGLEAMLEQDLDAVAGLSRKAMFGGLAWMVHGHLLCGARTGRMLLRIGKEAEANALTLPGISRMHNGRASMAGWVWLTPEAYGDDRLRNLLLTQALTRVQALPPKAAQAPAKKRASRAHSG